MDRGNQQPRPNVDRVQTQNRIIIVYRPTLLLRRRASTQGPPDRCVGRYGTLSVHKRFQGSAQASPLSESSTRLPAQFRTTKEAVSLMFSTRADVTFTTRCSGICGPVFSAPTAKPQECKQRKRRGSARGPGSGKNAHARHRRRERGKRKES